MVHSPQRRQREQPNTTKAAVAVRLEAQQNLSRTSALSLNARRKIQRYQIIDVVERSYLIQDDHNDSECGKTRGGRAMGTSRGLEKVRSFRNSFRHLSKISHKCYQSGVRCRDEASSRRCLECLSLFQDQLRFHRYA